MFHSQDGLFFTRMPDGKIEVRVMTETIPPREIFVTELDVSVFASVIASMTNQGEDSKTYEEAYELLSKPKKSTV